MMGVAFADSPTIGGTDAVGEIVYTDKSGQEHSVPIGPESPVVTIGRATDCTIQSTKKSVSRHHAEVRWENGTCEVVDLDSSNGTYIIIDGERHPVRSREQLTHNDEFWCGDFILHFFADDQGAYREESGGAPAEEEPPPLDGPTSEREADAGATAGMGDEAFDELERLREEKQSVEDLASRQAIEIEELQEEVEELERQLDEQSGGVSAEEFDRLENELEQVERERDDLAAELERAEQERDDLAGDLEQVEQERERLASKLDEAERGREQAEQRVDELQEELSSVRGAIEDVRGERDDALARNQELSEELESLRSEVDQTGELADELERVEEENESLRAEIDALESELEEAASSDEQLESLREERDELLERIDELEGEREELVVQIDELEEERDDVVERVDELEEEREELVARIDELESESGGGEPAPTGDGGGVDPSLVRESVDEFDRVVDAVERADLDELPTVDRVRLESALRKADAKDRLEELRNRAEGSTEEAE